MDVVISFNGVELKGEGFGFEVDGNGLNVGGLFFVGGLNDVFFFLVDYIFF